jgi:hypothetical protein
MSEESQPYGPGAVCETCGHFAERHDADGCHWPDRHCDCRVMRWEAVSWPRPWLPAPEGLTA